MPLSARAQEFARLMADYESMRATTMVDVFTYSNPRFEWAGGRVVVHGDNEKHERMTQAECDKRFPDDDDDLW